MITNRPGCEVSQDLWCGEADHKLNHKPYSRECQCSTRARRCKCGVCSITTACQEKPFCYACTDQLPEFNEEDKPEDQMQHLAEEEMTPAEKIRAFPLREEDVEDRDILVKEDNRGKFTLALMDAMVSLRAALVSLDSIPQDGSKVVDSVNHCRWAINRELWYLLQKHHTCDNIGGSPIPDDLMRYITQD